MVAGLSIASAVLQTGLRKRLRIGLEGIEGREIIIGRALQDVGFVMGLKGRIGRVVTEIYVRCLGGTHCKFFALPSFRLGVTRN